MAVQVSYPGVYIDEFAPGAPIEGVGTSTAAFIGPSSKGPLNVPVKVTSWDQFEREFGDSPLEGFYLWYAVRGFFENGGTLCYVTRVSNAAHEELDLDDLAGQPTIHLRAREPGVLSPGIQIDVDQDVHAVSDASAKVFRPMATVVNANAGDSEITVDSEDDAAKFRPGNRAKIEGTSEEFEISRIEGTKLRLSSPLSATHAAGSTVRLIDLKPGDEVLRVEEAERLSAGSVIKLSQTDGAGTTIEDTVVVKSVTTERISSSLTTYRVQLRSGLNQTFDLSPSANDVTVESYEFRITVKQGTATQVYDLLGMDPEHFNYYRRVINDDPDGLIYAAPADPPNTTPAPNNRPASLTSGTLSGGTNDNPAALTSTDYKNALGLFKAIDDVNLVSIPDRTDLDVQLAMIAHCENKRDRFAILDSRRGSEPFGTNSLEVHRRGLDSNRGFAALYYPWLLVSSANGTERILVPPSGHIAGIYARIDQNRGVHKAPAGIEATINGALGVERILSNTEQGELNVQGINIIRVFEPGNRPLVWGARTTATDRNWQYINVRRLLLFIEESIEEGIRWAVFEPNNLELWQKLKRTITEFLTRVWRDGALFGATAKEAFYVRIDEALNPPSERALGRLYIEVGVAPSYPAEFIILRIGIWRGGSEVMES